MSDKFLDEIQWNDAGLVAAIAQETGTGVVLMMAWMNRESLALSIKGGQVVYWSRSRNKLWRKGEESGNTQKLLDIRLDCDADVLLLEVEQQGGIACHTGRHSCFFRRHDNGGWVASDGVLRDPAEMYGQTRDSRDD